MIRPPIRRLEDKYIKEGNLYIVRLPDLAVAAQVRFAVSWQTGQTRLGIFPLAITDALRTRNDFYSLIILYRVPV
jgi:hypothetical protein